MLKKKGKGIKTGKDNITIWRYTIYIIIFKPGFEYVSYLKQVTFLISITEADLKNLSRGLNLSRGSNMVGST